MYVLKLYCYFSIPPTRILNGYTLLLLRNYLFGCTVAQTAMDYCFYLRCPVRMCLLESLRDRRDHGSTGFRGGERQYAVLWAGAKGGGVTRRRSRN